MSKQRMLLAVAVCAAAVTGTVAVAHTASAADAVTADLALTREFPGPISFEDDGRTIVAANVGGLEAGVATLVFTFRLREGVDITPGILVGDTVAACPSSVQGRFVEHICQTPADATVSLDFNLEGEVPPPSQITVTVAGLDAGGQPVDDPRTRNNRVRSTIQEI